MSWLTDFFHPGQAYGKAAEANKQGYEQGQAMRQPFIQQGQEAGNGLMDMYNNMMDPGALQNEWAQGYETSPYAQQMMGQAQSSGMDAASQMGLMGSSAALNNIQNQSSNIMQGDRQNYMNDMMQKYMSAMGLGENMYGQGANMAGQGANAAGQFGQQQAGYLGNQAAAGGNMLGNMLGGGAALAGGIFGGPMGGAVGNWFGKKIGNQQNNWGNYY